VRFRPHLEGLEARHLLSTYTVVLTTDTSGLAAGQMKTATSGDLRYCIAQADAAPAAKSDTIAFSPTVFAKPQIITLNSTLGTLTLNDSHPLTIKGLAGGKVTVSGGDQVGVFIISGGTVAISNLAITHGHAGTGGGIHINGGTVTLTNCTLNHDTASQTYYGGGGIYNNGRACTLSNNSASSYGGGIYAIGAYET